MQRHTRVQEGMGDATVPYTCDHPSNAGTSMVGGMDAGALIQQQTHEHNPSNRRLDSKAQAAKGPETKRKNGKRKEKRGK